MTWEEPKFVEIKMDAEVSSYQEDFGNPDPEEGVEAAAIPSSAVR